MARLILLGLWLDSLAAMVMALLMSLLQLLTGSHRAVRVFVGANQTLNAALGDSEDETISNLAGKHCAWGEALVPVVPPARQDRPRTLHEVDRT